MTVQTTLAINLLDGCEDQSCIEFTHELHDKLTSDHYRGCSILNFTGFEHFLAEHKTARKRAIRSSNRGYEFGLVRRHQHAADIYDINLSMPERQGRPMSPSYLEWPSWALAPLPDYPCDRHRIRFFGVFDPQDTLVAYASIYRCGQVMNVSQILGHKEHLANEIMYLLMVSIIRVEATHGGYALYSLHDGGTEGLRWFKERLSFKKTDVDWLM